jgi:RimJ/RimL family protein N-acetyltransferase
MGLPRGAGAPLLVREATLDDAAAIGEVHAEAWRVAHRDLFDGRWLGRFVEERRHCWSEIMKTRKHARNTLLLAEQGDRVVAFTYFGPHPDGMPDAEIFDLYAHPTAWGTGVAWTLMDAAWDLLRDARFRRVKAWTMSGANRARHFYESFGFTETHRTREHDFGDGRPVLEVEYLRATR